MAPATEPLSVRPTDHPEPLSSADKRLGTVVAGTYRLKRLIGSGGSSHVFEAEHLRLGKPFAVKLLRPELDTNRRTAQRFRREARAIAHLKSEHVVNVVDCGELEDGTPYLVMELLEGEDLRSLLNREGTLPARRAVALIIEACRGLSEVHAAGLVHRDLKPENLFITRRSTGEDWCKVLDFGVAKMEASLATAQGSVVGTTRYMAPEQLADGDSVGPATDVYGLGAVLYECLSGVPLVDGNSMQEVMYRIMNLRPRPLSDKLPSLPARLAAVVDSCVSRSPAQRPASADALARLLSATASFVHARPDTNDTMEEEDTAGTPLPRVASHSRSSIVMAALVSALGAGAAGWSLRGAPGQSTAGDTQAQSSATAMAAAHASAMPLLKEPAAAPLSPAFDQPVSAGATTTVVKALPAASGHPVLTKPTVGPSLPTPKAAGRFDSTNPYGE